MQQGTPFEPSHSTPLHPTPPDQQLTSYPWPQKYYHDINIIHATPHPCYFLNKKGKLQGPIWSSFLLTFFKTHLSLNTTNILYTNTAEHYELSNTIVLTAVNESKISL